MYTDFQRIRHIYDLQHFLRRIEQNTDTPFPLIPDGIFGSDTTQSVKAFQTQNGMSPTGRVDFVTWDTIFSTFRKLSTQDEPPIALKFFPHAVDSTLQIGGKGGSVFALQLMLDTLSTHFPTLARVPVSGEYDAETAAAVQHIQHTLRLPATGETDRSTWDALALLHNAYYPIAPLAWTLP